MTDKMISFLNHIHIDNVEAFDLDFEMVGRNRFKREQIDMVIVKKTPWKYHLLRQFQDGLNTLTYPYMLRFSYVVRPDMNDLLGLFDEWYQTLYHIPHNLLLEPQNDSLLKVTYANESEKEQYQSCIKDFRDFLDFLNYEFSIIEEVAPQEEEVNISKSEMRKIVQKANKEADEKLVAAGFKIAVIEQTETLDQLKNRVKSNEKGEKTIKRELLYLADSINLAKEALEEESAARQINDRSEVEQLIAEEKAQLNEETEDELLKRARQNAREMARDRERARLNKRGNYEPVDKIDDIVRTSDHVDFSAKVFSVEINEYGERKKLNIGLFDDEDGAIYANMYQNASLSDETIEEMKKWGTNVRVRGAAYFDEYNKTMAVKAHYIDLLPPDEIEPDTSEKKRVELHLHSNMSTMDGISHMMEYAKYAKALGHTAMAITDHAVVQGYPDAQEAGKKTGIKMLYGVEFYMVDDALKNNKNPSPVELNRAKFVVLDLETTGLNCYYDRIIEFGAVKVEHGIVTESMDILINPERPLPKRIVEITNITDKMLEGKPTIREALPKILDWIGDAILVTHNASFDFSFLQHALMREGMPIMNNAVIDTLPLSRYLFPESRSHTLGSLCRNMEVEYKEDEAHRADYDAKVLNDVWQPMLVLLTKKNHHLTHAELEKLETPKALLKHIRPTHVIALAKNKEGLKALYKLVSYSHILLALMVKFLETLNTMVMMF